MPQPTQFNQGKQDGSVTPPPSPPFKLNGNIYRTQVETVVTDGNIKSSAIQLQKQVTTKSGKDFVTYATSNDGGKTWVNGSGGKGSTSLSTDSGLTADEVKGLQPGGNLNKATVNAANQSAIKAGASKPQQDQLKAGNDTNAQQTAAAGEIPTEAAKVEIGATAPGTRTEFSTNLRYPLAMSNNQDVVKFTLVEFKPSTLNLGTKGGVSTFTRQGSTTPKGTIFLAIPGGISDTNTAGWGDDTMDPIKATLANVGLTAIAKGFGEGMAVLSQTASNTASDPSTIQDLKTATATTFASLAMQGDAQKLLTRTTGAVFNPNLELLFTGPELRSFSFTFKMSARNQPEADMIIRIIRTFKQAMAPQRTLSSIYVKAPLTFLISYHHKNEMHKKIGKIKECALVSLTTNYTPEGQYATYQDGTMLSYELQMQFKELEPVFNNDYTGPDTEIGY